MNFICLTVEFLRQKAMAFNTSAQVYTKAVALKHPTFLGLTLVDVDRSLPQ